MNTYKVRGLCTISFEKEVEANSREEAEEMAYDINIETEWNGNSVFVRDDKGNILEKLIEFNHYELCSDESMVVNN